MNRIKLAVFSLIALAFARPVGFCTANETTTDLLCKGAGVSLTDVEWRIQAGLSPAQAVEVALQEKREREYADKADKKKAPKEEKSAANEGGKK